MEHIRRCAELSVGRACAFALLGIFTFTIGLAGEPPLAIRACAIGLSLLAVVLWYLAQRAERVPYRRREVWLLLGREHHLPEERAHGIISNIMRDVYVVHARRLGVPALVCWAMDLGNRLFG
jgi:hypothetical protein